MEPREPRFPRQNYNKFNFLMQPMTKNEHKIPVKIQFNENIISIPKKAISRINKADSKGNVKIRGDQWKYYEMSQIFKNIKLWWIQKGLYIQCVKQPSLVAQISHITFNSLTSLNLTNNNIESIEALSSMQCPNLQRLIVSHNKITCIKNLRKVNFPNLISCSLGSNRILQYSPLCQLNAPLLKKIYQQHRADPGWCGSFNWIGKLQTNQLQGLWVPSDDRIWEKSSQKSFERKYLKRKQITFYVGLNYFED